MSEKSLFRLPRAARAWFSGTVFEPHVEAYVDYLTQRGYAAATVDRYLRCVAHFAHWSARRLSALEGVNDPVVRCFVEEHLPACRCARSCVRTRIDVRAALAHLLALLRSGGLTAESVSTIPAEVAAELEAFDDHLHRVRGLQEVTRQTQLKHIGAFLNVHFAARNIEVTTLVPDDMERFTRRYTAGWKPSSVKQVCIALRSYLRYKSTQGVETAGLAAALPHVAQWRLSGLPRAISQEEVNQLLGAFDRSTATGRRDYAIARCYVDLGLRTAEIARLQLEDLDWQDGRLQIRAKGGRTDVLPLPATTGHAIVEYLRLGRPQTSSRILFARHRPPLGKPATTDTIRGAIRNAALRCGLEKRLTGTHILRHTVACRLVQGGVSLKSIADLLRHRSLDTTTIYAKVDLDALSTVAAPWPGRRT